MFFFLAKTGKPYGNYNIFPKGMDVSVGNCKFVRSFWDAENITLISTEDESHSSIGVINNPSP